MAVNLLNVNNEESMTQSNNDDFKCEPGNLRSASEREKTIKNLEQTNEVLEKDIDKISEQDKSARKMKKDLQAASGCLEFAGKALVACGFLCILGMFIRTATENYDKSVERMKEQKVAMEQQAIEAEREAQRKMFEEEERQKQVRQMLSLEMVMSAQEPWRADFSRSIAGFSKDEREALELSATYLGVYQIFYKSLRDENGDVEVKAHDAIVDMEGKILYKSRGVYSFLDGITAGMSAAYAKEPNATLDIQKLSLKLVQDYGATKNRILNKSIDNSR